MNTTADIIYFYNNIITPNLKKPCFKILNDNMGSKIR